MQSKHVVAVRRDNGEKVTIAFDGLEKAVPELLENIHTSMFAKCV